MIIQNAYRMSRILITGASGFIGTNLIDYLQKKSLKILPFSRDLGFEYSEIVSNYINNEDINVIIHLAGKAHDLKNISIEQDYFNVNTDLTINIFNSFLKSNAKKFIFLSSVKAVKDQLDSVLTEEIEPDPISAYGKSKLASEQYILQNSEGSDKNVYILRPCMVHGPGNKGNLNLLYSIVSKQIPWPLGAFENKRSFCSIENLCFVINELIISETIPSGVYNISDDLPISTNDLVKLISDSLKIETKIFPINKKIIKMIAKAGDFFGISFNSENLNKLTDTYVVSNKKIKVAINKELPKSTSEGLLFTIDNFNKSSV